MKSEDIKVGMYVWWQDDKTLGGWSYPGIVGAFNGRVAIIITFDTFKTSGCSVLDNLRPASMEEMRDYLDTCLAEETIRFYGLQDQIKECEARRAQCQAKLAELSKQQ